MKGQVMAKEVIESTKAARDKFGHNYGSESIELSEDDLKALQDGKTIAYDFNGEEYTAFIVVTKEPQWTNNSTNSLYNNCIKQYKNLTTWVQRKLVTLQINWTVSRKI